ncbi:MAG: nucleotidyltransferase [Candidatus Cloacimonetes bacterium]|nr:nucleotidyltransferase [Candidatus Cloacimonadota bacterium]
MLLDKYAKANDLLEAISDELDIPESMYKAAKSHYESVGKWLAQEGTYFQQFNGTIFTQGSFMLGTMIRPYDENQDYDIDLVFRVDIPKGYLSQYDLKNKVEQRLLESNVYRRLLQPEKQRCWTLKYSNSERFHLDILPAIPDVDFAVHLNESFKLAKELSVDALAITDNKDDHYYNRHGMWPQSNPLGFGNWFKSRMEERYTILKEAYDIQQVPEYKRKTPLQRVVQILKRHRDMMYGSNGEHKPASIIITTLAASYYNNEDNIISALSRAVTGINALNDDFILKNPAHPDEIFTDKWNNEPEKRVEFNRWKAQLYRDYSDLVSGDSTRIQKAMYSAFDESVVKEAAYNLTNRGSTPSVLYDNKPFVQIKDPIKPYGYSN